MSLRDEAAKIELDTELRGENLRLVRQLEREKRRSERLARAVHEAVETNLHLLEFPELREASRDRRRKGEEVAVVWASDWQLGKRTPSYDSDVCEERVERYGEKVVELAQIQRADHPVKTARLWLLGDLVEGELIFPGQEHRIDASLYRQVTLDGPRILTNLVRRLAGEFEQVHVKGVIGNHGRLGGRASKQMHPETNADLMLYTIVRDLCNEAGLVDRVTWDLPYERGERSWYVVDDIGGYRTMLFHGDQIKGGGFAGFPFYGLAKRAWGWRTSGIDFHDLAFGHWHTIQKSTLNSIVARCNGTTESDNTWALEELASAGSPAQWLTFVYPGRGVTAEYTVYLDR